MSIQGEILRINTEITVQEDLMNSIIDALQGKAISGGGSSVEMEEGTFTMDTAYASGRYVVNFTNTHTKAPSMVIAFRVDDTPSEVGLKYENIINYYDIFGSTLKYNSTSENYGVFESAYRSSSTGAISFGSVYTISSLDDSDSDTTCLGYHLRNNQFGLYASGSSRALRGTWKWKALWL